jgi:hypothetical protein
MYEITQWDDRYEVNSNGNIFQPGTDQRRRSKPLAFVRSKVHGRSLGTGMRKLQSLAGPRAMEVFGIFHRLLEVAADASRDSRGILLNSDCPDDPATAEDLSFILNLSQEQVDNALTTLCEMGWISENSGKARELRESPGTPGKPGNSGKARPLINETETEPNRIEHNERDSDLKIKDDSDSDSTTNRHSFGLKLMQILPVWSSSDHAAFRNLTTELANVGDAMAFEVALDIAAQCRKDGGDNPKKSFMYRVQNRFGIKLNTPWRSNEAKRKATIKKAFK